MDYKTLLEWAKQAYETLGATVIEQLQELDYAAHSQAPFDAGFKTLWDDFKDQVQVEESFYFEAYQRTLRQICLRELQSSYIEWELLVMWLGTCDSNNHDLQSDVLDFDTVAAAICDEVLERIQQRAEYETIEYRDGYSARVDEEDEDEDFEPDEPNAQLSLF